MPRAAKQTSSEGKTKSESGSKSSSKFLDNRSNLKRWTKAKMARRYVKKLVATKANAPPTAAEIAVVQTIVDSQ